MKSTFLFAAMLLLTAPPSFAQGHLSLSDAIGRALAQNPAIRAAQAATGEASQRITQARAGYLPRLELVESAQRGNQPVFAFSSLLAERRFSAADFAIGSLNHPDAVTNLHTGLAVEQPIFDGFRARAATRAAEIGQTLAVTGQEQVRADLALAATRAYALVLAAVADRRAARAAVQAAEEDQKRAEHRRDAGLASEADVLALQVHVAQMRERFIRASSDETVRRAELNQAIGEPLDRFFALDDVQPDTIPAPPADQLEQQALAARPEVRTARLQEGLAREDRRTARAAFLPQISFQGFFDLNGSGEAFSAHASAWMVGAQARWTIFSGLADVARLREAGLAGDRVAADRERIETAVRLEVRTAAAQIQSATARQQVGLAEVAQARESQRIIRDRYEAGLASVSDVLRAADAVLEAESRHTAATVDLLVSNAMLDRAVGRVPAGR
jgi:outer membrane protein TolC